MCSFLVWKNACLNYREFDLEGDLVGVPHTWYLSAQSFITLLKLVWREYDIVAMNEWKNKCVGLQWTWVSKRTVYCNTWFGLFCFTVYRHPAKYTFGFYGTRVGLLLGEDCHRYILMNHLLHSTLTIIWLKGVYLSLCLYCLHCPCVTNEQEYTHGWQEFQTIHT